MATLTARKRHLIILLLIASLDPATSNLPASGNCVDPGLTSPLGLRACKHVMECYDSAPYVELIGLDIVCGEIKCELETGTCVYEANNIQSMLCPYTPFAYDQCDGDDTVCSKTKATGSCTAAGNTECAYRWCPQETTKQHTLGIVPSFIGNCKNWELPLKAGLTACKNVNDCKVSGALAIGIQNQIESSCGEHYCDVSTGICTWNVYNEDCGPKYIWCDGDHSQCDAYEGGSCTGWENKECMYNYCPLADRYDKELAYRMRDHLNGRGRAGVSPGDKCVDVSDCKPDAGKSDLASCGNLKCVYGQCIFEAWEGEKEECLKDYFVWCNGYDSLCTKGPVSNALGRCTWYNNKECSYRWYPGEV